MRQLSACSNLLDALTDKSTILLEANTNDPTLKEHVNGQVSDLQESFETLREMAQDLQSRLQDNIQTKQAYQETLQACEDWLKDVREKAVPPQDAVATAAGLDDAQKQLADLQVFGLISDEICLAYSQLAHFCCNLDSKAFFSCTSVLFLSNFSILIISKCIHYTFCFCTQFFSLLLFLCKTNHDIVYVLQSQI